MYKLPEILKRLRINNNLTLKQLSQKVNISAKRLSNWENGCNSPYSADLIKLTKYFNVSCDYLLGLID